MINGVNNTTATLSANLQRIIADGKVTKEEAANLSAADLKTIQEADANVVIEDGVEEVVAGNDTKNTGNTATKSNVDVAMPAETIDPAATAQLKAEIKAVRSEYELAKAESDKIAREIDEKEDLYDALQEQLKRAVSKVEDAAIEANEEVAIEVNKVRQQAQAEGWTEEQTKQKLSQIGIPSISSEQRNLESVGIDISALAKVITDLSNLYASQANTVDELADRWGGFLEVDLDTIHVDLSGKVVVNEAGTGGPEVSGVDGVSMPDMQKFSNMTNEELTTYMQSDAGKELLTAMQGMANEGVNLSAQDCAAILKTMLADQDKSTGNIAKFGTQYKDNLQVNEVNGASKEELEAAVKKISKKEECCCPPPPRDPYIVKVGDIEYVMIQDNKDGKWDTNDILGINDNKENLFEALKGVESDGDISKLTPEELKKAGIRLVAKQEDGTLAINDTSKDLQLKDGDFINMESLKNVDNKGEIGTFGTFTVHMDGKDYEGQETFEEMSTLQKLFGAVKEFFTSLGNVASDIIDKLKIDKDEKEWYSEGIKAKVAAGLKDSESAVNNTIRSSEDLLDETLKGIPNAEEIYSASATEEDAENQTPETNPDSLTEEEKLELAKKKGIVNQ